jgi:hypothetical protein
MKKILVLNYEFPPSSAVALAKADGGSASPVSYEIAERLSKLPLHSDIPPSFLRRGLGVVLGGSAAQAGIQSTAAFDIDVVTMGYKSLPKYEEVNKNFRIHRVKCLRSKKKSVTLGNS